VCVCVWGGGGGVVEHCSRHHTVLSCGHVRLSGVYEKGRKRRKKGARAASAGRFTTKRTGRDIFKQLNYQSCGRSSVPHCKCLGCARVCVCWGGGQGGVGRGWVGGGTFIRLLQHKYVVQLKLLGGVQGGRCPEQRGRSPSTGIILRCPVGGAVPHMVLQQPGCTVTAQTVCGCRL
jgi:hypothetical protein